MTDLADFLLARIAEDEDQARTFLADNHAALLRAGLPFRDSAMSFVVRVLAECDAKWRIVEEYQREADVTARTPASGPKTPQEARSGALGLACLFLALPYADHPDYDEAWRP